jgi:hypothetical protein
MESYFQGENMFEIRDGKKIAKRGNPGTLQAKTWIPLEPGWQVFDADDGHAIEIRLSGCEGAMTARGKNIAALAITRLQ